MAKREGPSGRRGPSLGGGSPQLDERRSRDPTVHRPLSHRALVSGLPTIPVSHDSGKSGAARSPSPQTVPLWNGYPRTTSTIGRDGSRRGEIFSHVARASAQGIFVRPTRGCHYEVVAGEDVVPHRYSSRQY